MKFFILSKKIMIISIIVFMIIVFSLIVNINIFQRDVNTIKILMGGQFSKQEIEQLNDFEVSKTLYEKRDVEKYFRPSKTPIINYRKYYSDFFDQIHRKNYTDIILPSFLLKSPEDTIINYFSVLREAANYEKGKYAGCGTLGFSKTPYPIAYKFLTSTYKERVSYEQYLNSFKNILHINLIKSKKIPEDEKYPNALRYFIEIETIEGSEKEAAYFAYYFGYIYISKVGNKYKISDLLLYGENYLCAPYHGWSYMAEAVIDIKYGNWCSLVKERYPTQQDEYEKKIYFRGTDENDYLFIFFQLTNDTDIEIAQYKKSESGEWELIKLDPEKCLENNR